MSEMPEPETCPVCLRDFGRDTLVICDSMANHEFESPCTHWFCTDCLAQFCPKGIHTCPICRADISDLVHCQDNEDDEDDEDDEDESDEDHSENAPHTTKIMLINQEETTIIKIWNHESFDADPDGTQYHRCLTLSLCGCEEPFKLKISDYKKFVKCQLEHGYRPVI